MRRIRILGFTRALLGEAGHGECGDPIYWHHNGLSMDFRSDSFECPCDRFHNSDHTIFNKRRSDKVTYSSPRIYELPSDRSKHRDLIYGLVPTVGPIHINVRVYLLQVRQSRGI